MIKWCHILKNLIINFLKYISTLCSSIHIFDWTDCGLCPFFSPLTPHTHTQRSQWQVNKKRRKQFQTSDKIKKDYWGTRREKDQGKQQLGRGEKEHQSGEMGRLNGCCVVLSSLVLSFSISLLSSFPLLLSSPPLFSLMYSRVSFVLFVATLAVAGVGVVQA